ncbi:MAG: uroporphyrinogen-III synthase [Balneolaceae bacterium]
MSTRHNILITKELNSDQRKLTESLGLHVVERPAIDIKFRNNWASFELILKKTDDPVFVFTSRNGVLGFDKFMKAAGTTYPANIPVYAVGSKTAEAVRELDFKNITIPRQQNGVGLAITIAEDFGSIPELKNSIVIHFCGNRRRDELRHFLTKSDITVKDIVVYETQLNEMELPDNPFDAVLFYSPSAVQAYRNSGGFYNTDLPELFAIGPTTAEELSIESGKHVHVSPRPDTETFLKFTARMLNEMSSSVI